jgi:thiamine biosynthesis lipoprotein
VASIHTADPVGVLGTVRAMACDVSVHGRTGPEGSGPDLLVERALEVFRTMHGTCTRFDPASPLMQMNARPRQWHEVPTTLFDTVQAAFFAYQSTRGVFDPRVLDDLIRLGYDRSLPFAHGVDTPVPTGPAHGVRRQWRPRFRPGPNPAIHLGGDPVDLGGIGKGLAVGWAAEILRDGLDDFLIDAGGDCHCSGTGPEDDGWRVGVEDPGGGAEPVAVLALRDQACATSSTRLRRWRSGAEPVHHLIDPATGRPGGDGLLAVTVVATDAADAEIATKSLFLGGASTIAPEADRRGIAALWVTAAGSVEMSPTMEPCVVWRAA